MKSSITFLRSLLGITIVIFAISIWRMVQVSKGSLDLFHSNWTYIWAIPFGMILFFFIISWIKPGESWFNALLKAAGRPAAFLRILSGIAFLASLPILSFLVLYPGYASLIHNLNTSLAVGVRIFSAAIGFTSIRVLLFWGSVLFGLICSKIAWGKISWHSALLLSLLANAVVYCLVVDFSQVNNYPFSLGWSEVSRYYGASLFFAKQLYNQRFPLTVLHPTWHLLLTVPFLLGNLPIWVHRLWQAGLQLGLTLTSGIVFTRRLSLRSRLVFWSVAAWAFLFLRQTLIMFSLLPAAIIILGWVRPRNFWLTSLLVLLASIWAGLSRINWFPVPGLLAGVLFLFEIPYRDSKSWADYLWKPVLWLLGGTIIALGVNSLYNVLSGNAVKGGQFASSLTSDLLWYRLLPNSTYALGILPAACLASIPLGLVIFLALRRYRGTFHPSRLAGIFTALAILLVGGLVVSIKIGGGADLHNLDAYFVMLMLAGGYFFFRRWTPEFPLELPALTDFLVVALAIIVPIWFILQGGGTLFTWDSAVAAKTEELVRTRTEQIVKNGGEVLFISQRQLLALRMVDAPLIPDYEQDYLMEMVMSHNQTYLAQFQNDLRQQRFAMIVSDPQNDHLYGRDHNFADENNLWVMDVARPLLCYYKPADSMDVELDVTMYIPSSQACK